MYGTLANNTLIIFNLALSLQTSFLVSNNCPAYHLLQASFEMSLKDVCFWINENVFSHCLQWFKEYSILRIATGRCQAKVYQ